MCNGCLNLFNPNNAPLNEDNYCKHCEDDRVIQDSIDRSLYYDALYDGSISDLRGDLYLDSDE